MDKMAKQEQRMNKNRESAARSRLRRQQHTAQLEQENEELRAQVEMLNQQVCALGVLQAWGEGGWLGRVRKRRRAGLSLAATKRTALGLAERPAGLRIDSNYVSCCTACCPQVEQLTSQLQDAEWQLQLAKVPANLPRASLTVSRNQGQTAGLSALPAAPSLSLSLPAASSLMLPAVPLVGGAGPQDGLAGAIGLGVESFDFAYTSRRGSSYA
jgi:hypothetical protein